MFLGGEGLLSIPRLRRVLWCRIEIGVRLVLLFWLVQWG